MRLANSLINKRYLLFKSKQILPYVIIMTVVGVAVTFVMNLCIVPSSYNDLNHIIVDGHLIFPGWAFMYVYPILLSLSLFSFMHKKNASDLFAAAPVTKKEYYLTNMLIALIYSAAMILIMMLSSILTVNLLNSTEIPQTVAFDAFIKIFLFLLLGFMQVYTITSTAATLTGTVPAQLFTAAVMLLAPTAIFMLFQLPTIADIDTTFSTTTNLGETCLAIYGKTANDFIYPLNIGTSPISILAALLSSNITESHGLITHFTDAPAMIYTLAIIVVYAIAGIEIFTKYKMENVERPFVNEKFGLIMRALIFLPVISLLVTLFHNDGSIFNEIFITLFVVITVAYIVADLILRKGIKGLSKSLGTYAIICVMSVIFGVTLGYIMEVNNDADPTLINKDDITKVTVYMEPLNMTPYEEENIKKYYIPIDLTDENIIENIVGTPNEKDYGNSFWFEIKAGNKKYFAKKRLTQDATNLIFRYIDDNPEIKKSLMINTGMSNHVKSDIMLIYSNASVNSNKNYMKTLTKRSEIRDIRKDFEAALLETPCVEIYSAKRSIDDAFIRQRWIASNGDSFGDNNSQIVMNEIKYHDGMYYLSSSELAYGSEAFEKVINSFNDKTTYLAVKQEKSSFYPVGSINLSKEQILNLESFLIRMPQTLKKEFREMVINAIDKEIIYDNSIIFSLGYMGKGSYFILNYERDIEPMLEKYADYICGIIADKAVSVSYGCLQYGEMMISNLGPSNQEAALAELRSKLPEIKELMLKKYTAATVPMELFKGYINYWVPDNEKSDGSMVLESVPFILDESFTNTLDRYLEEKEECEKVVEVRFYNYEINRELSFTKDDSEEFEALLQSVIFARLLYYGNAKDYYDKYEYVSINTSPDSSSIYVKDFKEVAISYYDSSMGFDATVIYSDGNEEIFYLRMTPKAYNMIIQAGFAK